MLQESCGQVAICKINWREIFTFFFFFVKSQVFCCLTSQFGVNLESQISNTPHSFFSGSPREFIFHSAVLIPHRRALGGACTSILFSPYFIINFENMFC